MSIFIVWLLRLGLVTRHVRSADAHGAKLERCWYGRVFDGRRNGAISRTTLEPGPLVDGTFLFSLPSLLSMVWCLKDELALSKGRRLAGPFKCRSSIRAQHWRSVESSVEPRATAHCELCRSRGARVSDALQAQTVQLLWSDLGLPGRKWNKHRMQFAMGFG